MGTKNYIIELEVFHQLHCLNDIRKAFYPERYPGKWPYNEDGTINRNALQWRHWGEYSFRRNLNTTRRT